MRCFLQLVHVFWYECNTILSGLPKNKALEYDGLKSKHCQFASHRVKVECDVTSKGNYHPIVIATIMSQILEICIQRRLDNCSWTTDKQFAYKKVTQQTSVFILKEIIRFRRKHRAPVFACCLDVSKAFDYFNHWKLLNVMIERKYPAFIIRLRMV